MKALSPQKGFALITVLFIVALVTIIASQLIYQQGLAIQRSANKIHQSQATAVSWGMESWIKKGLALDGELNKIDHLNEQWSQPMIPIPFEGGEIGGQLYDWQGRLNLNNLGETDTDLLKFWQQVFQRFFRQQELSEDLTFVVEDWVDVDQDLSSMGAESEAYLIEQPAYRAANQPLVMIEELGLLSGFNADIIAKIKPQVSVLPTVTALNVNTATPAALLALADWITNDLVQAWQAKRLLEPAEKIEDFYEFLKSQTGFEEQEIEQALPEKALTVSSQYFFLQGKVSYGEVAQEVSAIFYRETDNKVQLIQRWAGIAYE